MGPDHRATDAPRAGPAKAHAEAAEVSAPDKAPYIARVRELLVGMPRTVRGDGECEIHHLGCGGPSPWLDDTPIWGYEASYSVFATYDNRQKRYTRVWCYFPMPPNRNGLSLDVNEALEA
jgi:hypothetical protein